MKEWSNKKIWNQKDLAPPNYVGRIRSNLNFEVILKVKEEKMQNGKKCKIVFFAIFGKDTGHRGLNGLKFCTVPYLTTESLVSTLLFL